MKNRIKGLIVALTVLLTMIALTGCNLFSVETNNTDKNIKDNSITEEMPTLRYFFEDNESIILSEDSEEFFNNAPTDQQIEVVYELDFEEEFKCLHKEGFDFDLTSSKADELLTAHRLELKEFHTEKNFEFLEENDFDLYSEDYQIIISEYSPHVQILFEDIVIYENFYQDIADSQDLDIVHGINISAVAQLEETATRVETSSAPFYTMANVLNHINASSQTYTGSGINVGVLEADGIALSTSHSELNNLTIHTVGTKTSNHAISVIRTLCGSNGIARNVNAVYNYHTPDTGTYVSAMNWLLANNCTVINSSQGVTSWAGQYKWIDALMDYHVRNSWITFVASAGNEGKSTNNMCTPTGVGYNMITVGALDANNNVSTYSSFGANADLYTRKPTLAAPGTYIQTASWGSGTSFASPVVAGVVAKLLQEFPFLRSTPEVVISSLVASATPVNGQGASSWDTHAGAGRINYEKAREAVRNYSSFSNSTKAGGVVRTTKTINVAPGQRIKVAAVWLSNSTTTGMPSQGTNASYYIHTDYDLRLKTVSGNSLNSSSGLTNIEYISYNNTSYSQFVIELYQYGAKKTNITDWGGIAWCYL